MMAGRNPTVGFDRLASQFRRLDTLTASRVGHLPLDQLQRQPPAEKVVPDGLQFHKRHR